MVLRSEIELVRGIRVMVLRSEIEGLGFKVWGLRSEV